MQQLLDKCFPKFNGDLNKAFEQLAIIADNAAKEASKKDPIKTYNHAKQKTD